MKTTDTEVRIASSHGPRSMPVEKVNFCLVESMWELFLSLLSDTSNYLLALHSFLCQGVVMYTVPPLLAKTTSVGILFTLSGGREEDGSGCLALVLTQKPGKMHCAELGVP